MRFGIIDHASIRSSCIWQHVLLAVSIQTTMNGGLMNLKNLAKKTCAHFGYTLVRDDAPRTILTPMNSINVSRLLYYQNLFEKTKTIPGDIVECGVGLGRSLLSLALLVKITNDERNLWGFDSFEGFPEPSLIDMSSPRKPKVGEGSVSLQSVYIMLNEYIGDEYFIRSRITLVKGYFDQTLDQFPHERISLLNLDVDLYESYKICLEKLYPRLSVGGIVTFDEYLRESFAFPGAVKAISEFFDSRNVNFERDSYYGKYFVIKTDSD